jgi:hypothetical protein
MPRPMTASSRTPVREWAVKFRVGSAASWLVGAELEEPRPFARLDDLFAWVGHHGGGRVLLEGRPYLIPDRGIPGQVALVHRPAGSGLGWYSWQRCEENPRAFLGCGHLQR